MVVEDQRGPGDEFRRVSRSTRTTHRLRLERLELPIADPRTHTLALSCFGVSSRDDVDAVGAAALAAGGAEADGAEDLGFMYSRSFFDLDGHGWQVMWMDPAAG